MPTKRGLLPPAAHDMLARLVAPSPDDRPSSAQDVLDRLSQIRRRGMDIYAARAVIDDPPGQPVPLDRADRVVGVQDQPGQPGPAQGVVGGLDAGQPGAARRGAELGMDGPSAGARSVICCPQPGQGQVSGG